MQWFDVLKSAGYPTDVLVLDFETYFDQEYRIQDMTMFEYVMDPRFEELGHAVILVTQPYPTVQPAFWFADGHNRIRSLQAEYGQNLEKLTVVAQNAYFEGLILDKKYNCRPPHMIDTAGLLRFRNARERANLAAAAETLGIKPKGDTKQFIGLHLRPKIEMVNGLPKMVRKGMTPQEREALNVYACDDAEIEWEVFKRLLPTLSNPATELRIMQHTLDMYTQPRFMVDFGYGLNLIEKMEKRFQKIVDDSGIDLTVARSQIEFHRLMEQAVVAAGDRPEKYQKQGKKGPMFALAKDDDERELLLNHPNDRVRNLAAVRVGAKSWPNHIGRIETILRKAELNEGWLSAYLCYHGAHTGRWSGGEKDNLQNLPSRNPEEVINEIRGIIIPPPGKKLIVVDASQIEARGLAWIAGQDDLVFKFASGQEIYCDFASKVLGKPIRKARPDDPPPIKKYLTDARNNIGKVGVLGCGYGMGSSKAVVYAGGVIDIVLADEIVKTYRRENRQITQFWNTIEGTFRAVVQHRISMDMERGLKVYPSPDFEDCVVIELPNGRRLNYHKPRVTNGQIKIYNGFTKSWDYTWGGSLTENVVQALSRDLLAEATLRCEERGLPIGLLVHDEVLGVADESEAEKYLNVALEEMARKPWWAPDCPLAAEGQIMDRYGK